MSVLFSSAILNKIDLISLFNFSDFSSSFLSLSVENRKMFLIKYNIIINLQTIKRSQVTFDFLFYLSNFGSVFASARPLSSSVLPPILANTYCLNFSDKTHFNLLQVSKRYLSMNMNSSLCSLATSSLLLCFSSFCSGSKF